MIEAYQGEKLTTFDQLDQLTGYLNSYYYEAIIIADKNLSSLYPQFFNQLRLSQIFIDSGEQSKILESISPIVTQLLSYGCTKSSKIIGIGGGTITDLIGFIASILYRGIEHIFIPTTLLSMVDSVIGGKTSLNLQHIKNLLGTIYPAQEVIITTEFLNSLSNKEMNSGLVEIIKIALLADQNLFKNIHSNNFIFSKVINRAVELKQQIVKQDLRDRNIRKMLNYGHTIGHAIEAATNNSIPHGYAVALGILIENEISTLAGEGRFNPNNQLRELFSRLAIPTSLKELNLSTQNLIQYIKFDKKYYHHSLTMTALKDIGEGYNYQANLENIIHILTQLNY